MKKISPRYVDDGEDNWATIESLPDCNVSHESITTGSKLGLNITFVKHRHERVNFVTRNTEQLKYREDRILLIVERLNKSSRRWRIHRSLAVKLEEHRCFSMSVFLTSTLTRWVAVTRPRSTRSRSSRKSSYAGKQDVTKAVGNKPPLTERKNNDPRGREIIGARSLRVPQRQGQREGCLARSKDLHLHPAPGVRPDILEADGRGRERRLLFIVPSTEKSRKRRRRTKSIRWLIFNRGLITPGG